MYARNTGRNYHISLLYNELVHIRNEHAESHTHIQSTDAQEFDPSQWVGAVYKSVFNAKHR